MDLSQFHAIIVHFPVTFITIVFILDLLRVFFGYRPFFIISHWSLIIGSILLLPTIVTGLDAANYRNSSDYYLGLHELMAYILLGFSVFHSFFRVYALYCYHKDRIRKISPALYVIFSGINLILISITGDLGGMLVHGSTPFMGQKNDQRSQIHEKDPYHVRFMKPEKLRSYLQENISYQDVKTVFDKYSCQKCHTAQFSGVGLTGFTIPQNGEEAWLPPKSKDGKMTGWENSVFYKVVILNNEMPIDNDNEVLGMSMGDRLTLLKWLENNTPLVPVEE